MQFPHFCFFEDSIETSQRSAFFFQKSAFGSFGFSGPYPAVSIAFWRFLILTAMSRVAGGHGPDLRTVVDRTDLIHRLCQPEARSATGAAFGRTLIRLDDRGGA
jgi:hypothetical protein